MNFFFFFLATKKYFIIQLYSSDRLHANEHDARPFIKHLPRAHTTLEDLHGIFAG